MTNQEYNDIALTASLKALEALVSREDAPERWTTEGLVQESIGIGFHFAEQFQKAALEDE